MNVFWQIKFKMQQNSSMLETFWWMSVSGKSHIGFEECESYVNDDKSLGDFKGVPLGYSSF